MRRKGKHRGGFVTFGAENRRPVDDPEAFFKEMAAQPRGDDRLAKILETERARAWKIVERELGVSRAHRYFIDEHGCVFPCTREELNAKTSQAIADRTPFSACDASALPKHLGIEETGELAWALSHLWILDCIQRALDAGDHAEAIGRAFDLGHHLTSALWEFGRGDIVRRGRVIGEGAKDGGIRRASEQRRRLNRRDAAIRAEIQRRMQGRGSDALAYSNAVRALVKNWPDECGPPLNEKTVRNRFPRKTFPIARQPGK